MEESRENKMALLRQMIENADRNVTAAKQVLAQIDGKERKPQNKAETSQIVEGTFDGEKMIGMDDRKYPIPVNYASKSKLVEGDLLKLTIMDDGSFVFKQISPIERRTIIGTVIKDGDGKNYIYSEGKKYKVLLASLTYFKAKEGDEVTLIVPKEKISQWGAIEAVIGTSEGGAGNLDSENYLSNDEEKKDSDDGDLVKNLDEENKQNKNIEDEWMPDIEEMKKEAQFDKNKNKEIADDFSF